MSDKETTDDLRRHISGLQKQLSAAERTVRNQELEIERLRKDSARLASHNLLLMTMVAAQESRGTSLAQERYS